MGNRDTKLAIPKTELHYWSEEDKTFKPLSVNGGIPVYIIGGEGGTGGVDGKSAYEVAVEQGFEGTVEEWLISLKGDKGDKGDKGNDGVTPVKGVDYSDGANGKDGTNGIDGKDGVDGKSAYQIWIDAGNTGTEQDFLNYLKGDKGDDGENGKDGANGTNGVDGKDGFGTESQYNDLLQMIADLQTEINALKE